MTVGKVVTLLIAIALVVGAVVAVVGGYYPIALVAIVLTVFFGVFVFIDVRKAFHKRDS